MKLTKKNKKIALIISIPILLIAQYYLYKAGFISPLVKGVDIQVSQGDYVKDIDKYVIKLDEGVTLSMGDFAVMPSYAKDPDLRFNILDDMGVVEIQGDKLIGVKEGYTSIGIMKGTRILKQASIRVVDPKVLNLELSLEKDIKYVGDKSDINTDIEVDYDKFKNKEKVTYKSTNENVIKISGQTVEAVGVGEASIIVESKEIKKTRNFNIEAKVDEIDINKEIQIEVGQQVKLKPNIITEPENLIHPKIKYSYYRLKIPVQRAVNLDERDGTIIGIREGEEIIRITCGEKTKLVKVKVVKESITNNPILNLNVDDYIIDGNIMRIKLSWDYMKDIFEYDVFLKNNSLGENEFNYLMNFKIDQKDIDENNRVHAEVEINIEGIENPNISLYVVGKTKYGYTKESNSVTLIKDEEKPSEDDTVEEKLTLTGSFDLENKKINLSWNKIKGENVVYSVYIKNKASGESEYISYKSGINETSFSISIEDSTIDFDIYVVGESNGQLIETSNTLQIKQ